MFFIVIVLSFSLDQGMKCFFFSFYCCVWNRKNLVAPYFQAIGLYDFCSCHFSIIKILIIIIMIISIIQPHNVAAIHPRSHLVLYQSILQFRLKKYLTKYIFAHSSHVTKYILGMNGFLGRTRRIYYLLKSLRLMILTATSSYALCSYYQFQEKSSYECPNFYFALLSIHK